MSVEGSVGEGVSQFVIGADHPSLPGHFPGSPVVPGVVVLDHVLAIVGAPGDRPRTLAWVKFVRPLLPEQVAEVRWTRNGANLRFTVSHAGDELARGLLTGGAS